VEGRGEFVEQKTKLAYSTLKSLKKKRKKWQNELKIEIFSPLLHRYAYNSKKLEKQTYAVGVK